MLLLVPLPPWTEDMTTMMTSVHIAPSVNPYSAYGCCNSKAQQVADTPAANTPLCQAEVVYLALSEKDGPCLMIMLASEY